MDGDAVTADSDGGTDEVMRTDDSNIDDSEELSSGYDNDIPIENYQQSFELVLLDIHVGKIMSNDNFYLDKFYIFIHKIYTGEPVFHQTASLQTFYKRKTLSPR